MIRILATELHNVSIWKEYLSIVSDPAHLMAEFTVEIISGGLIGAIVWPKFKAWVARHDREKHGGHTS